MVALGRGGVSYERGTPVDLAIAGEGGCGGAHPLTPNTLHPTPNTSNPTPSALTQHPPCPTYLHTAVDLAVAGEGGCGGAHPLCRSLVREGEGERKKPRGRGGDKATVQIRRARKKLHTAVDLAIAGEGGCGGAHPRRAHPPLPLAGRCENRGTSLIRNILPLGPAPTRSHGASHASSLRAHYLSESPGQNQALTVLYVSTSAPHTAVVNDVSAHRARSGDRWRRRMWWCSSSTRASPSSTSGLRLKTARAVP